MELQDRQNQFNDKCVQKQKERLQINDDQGSLAVIFSGLPFKKEWNVQFTTVPVKTLNDQERLLYPFSIL